MPLSARHAPSLRLAAVLAFATLAAACGKSRVADLDAGCLGCHGGLDGTAVPSSGAHAAHVNLATHASLGYGQEWIAEDASPAHDQSAYSFGCGLCHPKDRAKHSDGTVDVDLSAAGGAAGGLRARNGATAAYDKASGTCSNVYCHSSGQATPVYVTTPNWATGHLPGNTCGACHGNPPSYANAGPAQATANSHIFLNAEGRESGHFAGLPGPIHYSRHGQPTASSPAVERGAPITCQACHAETVDPTNVASGGFFYLDTSITTQLAGGDATRLAKAAWKDTQCVTCHDGATSSPSQGTGRVRPAKHINGVRDVTFDKRTAPPAAWLFPSLGAEAPTRPYFMTSAHLPPSVTLPIAGVGIDGTNTVSFELSAATYAPATMTCSSVACHLGRDVVWGNRDLETSPQTCTGCHP